MATVIATYNVNGIRAAYRNGIAQWLADTDATIVAFQEVRAPADITRSLLGEHWQVLTSECAVAGRAGVAVAWRRDAGIEVRGHSDETIPVEHPSDTGRWLEVDLDVNGVDVRVVSAYLHSGEVGSPRQDYKMSHLVRVGNRLDELAAEQRPTLVVGDFNVVRSERDMKTWKRNHNRVAGVLDTEIAHLDTWMGGEWVDVARQLVGPDCQGPYTWWSYRGKAFDTDAGWRIDYQMATRNLADLACDVRVDRADAYERRVSDHAPLLVTYDLG